LLAVMRAEMEWVNWAHRHGNSKMKRSVGS